MIHPTKERGYWKFNFERPFNSTKGNEMAIGESWSTYIKITGLGNTGDTFYNGIGIIKLI